VIAGLACLKTITSPRLAPLEGVTSVAVIAKAEGISTCVHIDGFQYVPQPQGGEAILARRAEVAASEDDTYGEKTLGGTTPATVVFPRQERLMAFEVAAL